MLPVDKVVVWEADLKKGNQKPVFRGLSGPPQSSQDKPITKPKGLGKPLLTLADKLSRAVGFSKTKGHYDCEVCKDTHKVQVPDECHVCEGQGCEACNYTGETAVIVSCPECK